MRPPKIPNLDARLRVERRRELLIGNEDAEWDDGEQLEFDGGEDIHWDDEEAGDGAGNFEGDWTGIGPAVLRGRVTWRTLGATETVQADKLKGSMFCEVEVRASTFTRQITTDDRLIWRQAEGDTVLNIRAALPPGRGHFLRFICEAGVAT
jgi:hypothetical protein